MRSYIHTFLPPFWKRYPAVFYLYFSDADDQQKQECPRESGALNFTTCRHDDLATSDRRFESAGHCKGSLVFSWHIMHFDQFVVSLPAPGVSFSPTAGLLTFNILQLKVKRIPQELILVFPHRNGFDSSIVPRQARTTREDLPKRSIVC